MIPENVYGHRRRLEWVRSHIDREQAVIEVGCGTGHMITRPLLEAGYRVTGVDVDSASIAFGRRLFREANLDPSQLVRGTFQELAGNPGAVIISEVLEHLSHNEIRSLLGTIRQRLQPGGVLLVTVPNGYGWFEMENALWNRTGLGRGLERVGIPAWVATIKQRMLGREVFDYTPSSLNPEGHIQRFTASAARKTLEHSGFRVRQIIGSTLVAGPLSDLVFGGLTPLLRVNVFLGELLTTFASGFYLAAARAEP